MSDLEPRINVQKIALKGALGSLPVIGSIVNEILTELIPDRRWERVSAVLERLEVRVAKLEPVPSRESWSDSVFVDLLEDGLFQSARAGTSDRIDQIAAIVAGGLGVAPATTLERRFLLGLLGQLNDVEVLQLIALGKLSTKAHNEFYHSHQTALARPHPVMGAPQEELDKAAVFSGYDRHLEYLGLVRFRTTSAPRKGQVPEFDQDGRLKGAKVEISPLGRALLRAIDQPPEF